MFIDGLRNLDPNPVMAFFVVIAIFAVVANLLADLLYAVLDPRIRIGGLSHDGTDASSNRSHRRRRRADEPSIADEQPFEQKEVAGLSQGQIVRRRFFRHKGAMVSLVVLIVHRAARHHEHRPRADPRLVEVGATPTSCRPSPDDGPTMSLRPTWLGGAGIRLGDHPFGLDNETGQRHVRADDARACRRRLVVILVLGVLALVDRRRRRRPVPATSAAGSTPSLMRFTDVIIVIPLLARSPPSPATPSSAQRHVDASRSCSGCSPGPAWRASCGPSSSRCASASSSTPPGSPARRSRRIIFKHILPNTVGMIVVSTTLLMGAGILTEAALGFLGFGIQPPDVSLGSLVERLPDGAFSSRPWLFVWPGVFIIVIVLCLQFIGDGLRDAFDPRQKRIPKRKDLERGDARADAERSPRRPTTGRRLSRRDVRPSSADDAERRPAPTPTASVSTCQRTGPARARAADRRGGRRRAAAPSDRGSSSAALARRRVDGRSPGRIARRLDARLPAGARCRARRARRPRAPGAGAAHAVNAP